MDLSEAATFTLAMAEAQLDTHMRQEVAFLGLFDRVKRHINKRYAERVQAHVLDAIEQTVSRAMQGQPLDDEADDQEENWSPIGGNRRASITLHHAIQRSLTLRSSRS